MVATKKTIEETYQKKNLHEHILDVPDTYIGSIKNVTEEQYVLENEQQIVKKVIEYNPGLFKIFDEILVNAVDQTVRDPTCTQIKVNIEKNQVTVFNNGKGIPVQIHKEYNIYVPELIFGNLLSGENYNKNEKRTVGGKNGFGAKLCNIYSTEFLIETTDTQNCMYYSQTFENNMYKVNKPIIKSTKKKGFTQITFKPDFKRFGLKHFTDDLVSLLSKRVYDCTATTNKNVSVYLNDKKINYKDFVSYSNLYSDNKGIHEVQEYPNGVWEVIVKPNDKYEQISFVNGIATTKGGKHVDYIVNQITKKLTEYTNEKKKAEGLKPNYIRDTMIVFIRATIENPGFGSQTKEELTTNIKDFGFKFDISEEFIKKLYKTDIIKDALSFTKFQNEKDLLKTMKTPKKKKINIPKLDDAELAGKDPNCTLILTEGDSAKTFAISGLSTIGRKYYGVFPIRGKFLNVREATDAQLKNNVEVKNLIQILGLDISQRYTTTKTLRYSSIIILTDADHDGSHIKGLLMNFIEKWWPDLLKIKGFIRTMKTPIVKASKGKEVKEFYSLQAYKEWVSNASNKWSIKYYKGLGTSTAKEAKELFTKMSSLIVNYTFDKDSKKNILLAFEKKQADNRKEWIQQYDYNVVLDQFESDITYSDFINKELIHFSMADNMRSIPSICDGLKPSQRKIIHTMFEKYYNKNEIKVAQLGGAVSEFTEYHHGEDNLYSTIINMAQDYPGSNNINLLLPIGQFGTRIQNGKDQAQPRYIFTKLNDITKKIYHKDDLSDQVVEYQIEESQRIEPKFYMPLIPMVLVNGSIGIGTGYATKIPMFNPKEIINNILLFLDNQEMEQLVPWYKGFKGDVKKEDNGSFIMEGKYKIEKDKIIITEIPLQTSIEDYKEFLVKLEESNECIKEVRTNGHSENEVTNLEIHFNNFTTLKEFLGDDPLKKLDLRKKISGNNYHLFNVDGRITKYFDELEIIEEFVQIRIEYYTKRKEHLINKLEQLLKLLRNKLKFLKEIMDNTLKVFKRPKQELIDELTEKEYDTIDDSYNYLINLPIHSFTKEKISELMKEYKKNESELKIIKSKGEIQMYKEDLNVLLEEL